MAPLAKRSADAIVGQQIQRHFRPRMPTQIGWRCNDRGAGVLADANGDHVAPDAMAGPDAGVETVANDVGQRAIGDDLKTDRGICGRNFDSIGSITDLRGRAGNGEPQVAARLVADTH